MTALSARFSAALIALTVFLGAARASADCTTNAECKGGRICKAGTCTAVACGKDTDCPGEFVCKAGTCASNEGPPPATPAATPPAAVPAPPAATGAPGGAPPAKPGTAQALSGMEQMVLDCNTATDDPRCKGQKGVVLSQTFVIPPAPRTLIQFSIGGGYRHGFISGASIFSGGMDIGASLVHGVFGPMPDARGGAFHAIIVEPMVWLGGGGLITTGAGATKGAGLFTVQPRIQGGFEFGSVGAFNAEKRSQFLVGAHILYAMGGQYMFLAGDVTDRTMYFSHGPAIGVTLGQYKSLDKEAVRGYIRFQLTHLPSPGIAFLGLTGGAGFP